MKIQLLAGVVGGKPERIPESWQAWATFAMEQKGQGSLSPCGTCVSTRERGSRHTGEGGGDIEIDRLCQEQGNTSSGSFKKNLTFGRNLDFQTRLTASPFFSL